MPNRKPNILVADDDLDLRNMLSDWLAYQGYCPLVAADGQEALALAATHRLDLALVDICMPGPSGMELAARLNELDPNLKVIIITAYGTLEDGVNSVRKGAFHYLTKPLRLRPLLETVEEALTAEARSQASRPTVASESQRGKSQTTKGESVQNLSPRQMQVLRLIGQGKTNREIATELDISEKTVDHHVCAILNKLEAANRTQAALIAQRDGLVSGKRTTSGEDG